MITAIVQFQLPQPLTAEEAAARFAVSVPKFRNLPGLVRKYYLLSEDGRTGGGVYLWESREAAERLYNGGEWRERIRSLYGAEPQIGWFESPVIVDNSSAAENGARPAAA